MTGKIAASLAAFVILTALAAKADAAPPSDCTLDRVQTTIDAAILPCTRLIEMKEISPADLAQALNVRGRTYERTGQIDRALSDYERALSITPDNDDIYVSRASVLFKRDLPEAAMNDLAHALELNSKNGRALRWFASFYHDAGRSDEALAFYSEALQADPKDPYALLDRSEAYVEKRMFKEALGDADALVGLPPEAINKLGIFARGRIHDFHVKALENRSSIYAKIGNREEAERDLDQAVAYKRSSDSLLARARYRLSIKQAESALTDLDEAASLSPDDSDIGYTRALTLLGFNRTREAADAFAQITRARPGWGSAHFFNARALRGVGRPDDAVTEMERAIALDTTLSQPLNAAMRAKGYWASQESPNALTPAYRDAIRACMLDETCN